MLTLKIRTNAKTELLDITGEVEQAVADLGVGDGVCLLFVPHTTAGLTLNENWDPSVRNDILLTINDLIRHDPRHRHGEGNSPAHIDSSLFGANLFVFVGGGKLQLGTWQGIYFAEFDGPRNRKVWLTVLKG
ncbi:MAG: YjbQ family protein [Anaerolineae bacterium]|nr:YjbQ family protein [Anaerolineae bacterium]